MNGPISFPRWKEQLAQGDLRPSEQEAFRREVLSFLRHCKVAHAPATAELAKQYLSEREKLSRGPAREALRWFFREGARWMRMKDARGEQRPEDRGQRTEARFGDGVTRPIAAGDGGGHLERPAAPSIVEGESGVPVSFRGRSAPPTLSHSAPPRLAAEDLGSEPWERQLVRVLRERGMLWRTEQTWRNSVGNISRSIRSDEEGMSLKRLRRRDGRVNGVADAMVA